MIEFYLLLQGERFAGKITYDILCSEEVKNARIPRLSVEPLVENVVSHGLEPKPGKRSYQGGSKRRKWEAADSDQR